MTPRPDGSTVKAMTRPRQSASRYNDVTILPDVPTPNTRDEQLDAIRALAYHGALDLVEILFRRPGPANTKLSREKRYQRERAARGGAS